MHPTPIAVDQLEVAADPLAPPPPHSPLDSPLAALASWLVANGAVGLDGDGPRVSLYVDGDARGVLALESVAEGEELFSVPARLALTDAPTLELPLTTPWTTRLACRVLDEVERGGASPWAPYLAALPAAPLRTPAGGGLPASLASLLPCPGARADYEESAAAPALELAALPHGARAAPAFTWARALATSRALGLAAPGGAVGVRAMVPLLDMVNHAGVEAELTLSGPCAATANAEWEPVPTPDGAGVSRFAVYATRDIGAGEEVTFSYGDRPNGDLLASWGFVPPRNAADGVALFLGGVEEALDWAAEHCPVGGGGERGLRAAALAAAAAAAAADPSLPPRLHLWPGAGVDPRLAAALEAVGGAAHARAVVAARAAALLSANPAPPLIPLLGELGRAEGHEEERHYYTALARRYIAASAAVAAGGGDPGAGGAAQPPKPAADRAGWRAARLLALRAAAYSLMILWDCVAARGKEVAAAEREGEERGERAAAAAG
jgi:hypothetical protein